MKNFLRLLTLAAALVWIGTCTPAAEAQSVPGQPFVVEYYYKTKWGHADEFLQLFKKNHYPLLKKEIGNGPPTQGLDGPTALSHHGRRPLGLSRDHCLQECHRGQ